MEEELLSAPLHLNVNRLPLLCNCGDVIADDAQPGRQSDLFVVLKEELVDEGVQNQCPLHWDVCIPIKRIKNDLKGDLTQWASHLADEIKFGAFSSQAASWLSSNSLTETNSLCHLNAAVAWATHANTFNCKVVWPYINGHLMPETDLSGDYFSQIVATVDLQIAKAGYRPADWLNRILDDCAGVSTSGNGGSSGEVPPPPTGTTSDAPITNGIRAGR
ncbi:hypothetical protein BDK51DRAFT_28168 [Blyttiomyces helicus]|uniref:Uncharacterized protein n=1 Tax=Blyttiomyces helicus TaxID=388810 RepID=A0A4P9WBF5_9FUNG|nr:hypothetical protein BDK51DRAFT_28168 [Blyttiomyces helicus]|eukprot:RKO89814.1 hypothetical protein BDK51DRAFT_28168 [Blyttiomyces helicus]